ncbi:hypothetical protein GZZ44_10575 [Klebsiella aerogenes]|uniref:hypothetical protein n=1 Tax=Klebsiella aerogenes TaxID=548 RepID=UPI00190EA257|nr:hypothetical protein [Klebsiella aerogenes]MBK0633392.1 hypothetical protein [Klebsiella aerogenes]
MTFKPTGSILAAFLLAGCSFSSHKNGELDAVSVGNSCAAASDGNRYAVSCANPEREKALHAFLLMVERNHNAKNPN